MKFNILTDDDWKIIKSKDFKLVFWGSCKTNAIGCLIGSNFNAIVINGRFWSIPRIAWALDRKRDPGSKVVAHRCDTRNCRNPRHLWLTTQRLNLLDMLRKGRQNNAGIPRNVGIKNKAAKHSIEQVIKVKKALGKYLNNSDRPPYGTYTKIAIECGVDFPFVRRIAKGSCW